LRSGWLISSQRMSSGLYHMPTQPEELNQIAAAKEILLNAEAKFPKEAIIKYNLACYCCQLGEIENAKNYLKKVFEIDSTWRVQVLDDEDLRPVWDSL
jgi:tetratricopeptide (TPR) repeat protein